MVDRVVDRRQQVVRIPVNGLDQENPGARCDGVDPLNVQRDLPRPRGIGGRQALWRGDGEAPVRDRAGSQSELRVKCLQVGLDGRVVVGVDDADRLAAPAWMRGIDAAGELVEGIGVEKLPGRVAADVESRGRLAGVDRRAGGPRMVHRGER